VTVAGNLLKHLLGLQQKLDRALKNNERKDDTK
jgi:hypothetical protein